VIKCRLHYACDYLLIHSFIHKEDIISFRRFKLDLIHIIQKRYQKHDYMKRITYYCYENVCTIDRLCLCEKRRCLFKSRQSAEARVRRFRFRGDGSVSSCLAEGGSRMCEISHVLVVMVRERSDMHANTLFTSPTVLI